MKKHRSWLILGLIFFSSPIIYLSTKSPAPALDDVFLAIVKNDAQSFAAYMDHGGALDNKIMIDGTVRTIGELVVKYERKDFLKKISQRKIPFKIDESMWEMAISKNNPELFKLLMDLDEESQQSLKKLDHQGRNYLHHAGLHCSNKLISLLQKHGMKWNDKDDKGATPLTLAAENECLKILSSWKTQGVNLHEKDGRGLSAVSILEMKNDPSFLIFSKEAAPQAKKAPIVVAALSTPPQFYKKRHIPKDNLADRAHLIGPNERPDEANETSQYSEFSD